MKHLLDVEYLVRSAQTAVFSLLGLGKHVSPIYQVTTTRACCSTRSKRC